MSKLYIMVGAPGSGKTTWCKEHLTKEDVYISRDEIRFSLLKPQEAYFSKENQVYQLFISKIERALNEGKNVYADQTSLDESARAKLLKSLQVTIIDEIHAVWMDTPLEKCLLQNNLRTGLSKVPENSVKQMFNKLTIPKWEEGIKYLHIIKDNEETVIDLEKEHIENGI